MKNLEDFDIEHVKKMKDAEHIKKGVSFFPGFLVNRFSPGSGPVFVLKYERATGLPYYGEGKLLPRGRHVKKRIFTQDVVAKFFTEECSSTGFGMHPYHYNIEKYTQLTKLSKRTLTAAVLGLMLSTCSFNASAQHLKSPNEAEKDKAVKQLFMDNTTNDLVQL